MAAAATTLAQFEPADLAELSPLVRRAAGLDPGSLARMRVRPEAATAYVRLPFEVLVGRRIAGRFAATIDSVYAAVELLGWLDGSAAELPRTRDADWRTGLPPETGWRPIEMVPDDVIRGLVRKGALTLEEAAQREGVPLAQPRAEVADALLDSVVLTAEQGTERVEVSLRLLSALVRMGFLARDSHLRIDTAGRWLRLTASYGSVYAEHRGLGIALAAHPHRRVGG